MVSVGKNLAEADVPSTGTRAPEGLVVLRRIGDVQPAAIQADQSPLSIPTTLGALLGNGAYHRIIESLQWLGPQAASGLRDARFSGHFHFRRRVQQPLHTFQQATQYLPIGGPQIQRQRDDVIDHDMRSSAFPKLRFVALLENGTLLIAGAPLADDVKAHRTAFGAWMMPL